MTQVAQDRVHEVEEAAQACQKVMQDVAQVIVGQQTVVEQSLIALFAQGHSINVHCCRTHVCLN